MCSQKICTTDAGYAGAGIHTTAQAGYSEAYARDDDGEHVMLLCWVQVQALWRFECTSASGGEFLARVRLPHTSVRELARSCSSSQLIPPNSSPGVISSGSQ